MRRPKALCLPSILSQQRLSGATYHAQKLPHRITRLRANTEPVLRTSPVEGNLLVWAGIGVLVIQVGRTLRDGVEGADDLEGLRAASRPRERRLDPHDSSH